MYIQRRNTGWGHKSVLGPTQAGRWQAGRPELMFRETDGQTDGQAEERGSFSYRHSASDVRQILILGRTPPPPSLPNRGPAQQQQCAARSAARPSRRTGPGDGPDPQLNEQE